MERRILAVVAIVSGALGIGGMLLRAPDTGPGVQALASAPQPASAVRALPSGVGEPLPAPPGDPLPATPPGDPLPRAQPAPTAATPPSPRPRDEPPHDLAQTYAPTAAGLAGAALARSDRLRACLGALDPPTGALVGRVPVTLILSDGGSSGGKVDASAASDEPSLQRCLSDAVSDATFPSPGDRAIRTVIPIYLPPG